MPIYHSPADFLALHDWGRGLPLLDVRSPGEFAAGHIEGAINLPLFDDEQRAAVGTAHARGGKEAAAHVALELVGPQLAAKLSRARHVTGRGREALVHCWRGGMRSATMAWLLEAGGYVTHVLAGGYKAYRGHARQDFARPARILVLGGMTGSGKTEILHELARLGSQVLDLEGVAGHRGSAFGGVGRPSQPGSEEVENRLYSLWERFDFSRPIWLEDENRQIGAVTLPDPLFFHITSGRLVLVDSPLDCRVTRLARLYAGSGSAEDLLQGLERIRKRLGDESWRLCVAAVREGRCTEAVRRALVYYDKAYAHLLERTKREVVLTLDPPADDPVAVARLLAAREEELAG